MDVGALVKREDYVRMRNLMDLDQRSNHFLNYDSWLRSAVHHMNGIRFSIKTRPEERRFLERQVDIVFSCIFDSVVHGGYGVEEKRALVDVSKRNRLPLLKLFTERKYLAALEEYTRVHKGLNGAMETAGSDGEFYYQNKDLGPQLRRMVGFMCVGIDTEMLYVAEYRRFARSLSIEESAFPGTVRRLRLPYKK